MNRTLIMPVLMLFLLLAIVTVDSQITWPGEKKLAGYTTLDQLQGVFAQDTSAYGRRYLVQALPFFVEKNNITSAPPSWLVKEISKAVVSGDPNLALEGIVTTQKLNIRSLSDTLVGVYRKVRMRWPGQRQRYHMPIVQCLVSFNDPVSRQALMDIAGTPLPVKIAEDVVPALKGVRQIGDTTCVNALIALSARLNVSRDSISAIMKNTPTAAADTVQVKKLGQISALADGIRQSIQAKGGLK
jgi:hypothetical protein